MLTLRWERVAIEALTFRVEDTKTRVALELPITRQLSAIIERCLAEAGDYPAHVRDWVFPSPTSATGHVQDPHHLYARISETGGAKFWFHGLRNCFITVAERELMLPPSLIKRLVNHARPNDVNQGVEKRPEHRDGGVEWRVAMKPGRRRLLGEGVAEEAAEKRKASVRAKVEHPFLYVKRHFGYAKVRYRGVAKNRQRIALLLGFSNLPIAGRYATG